MSVKIRTGAALKSLLDGNQEAEAEGATVGELLKHLAVIDRLCDGEGHIRRHFNIHVNDSEDVRLLDGLNTAVADGDVVTILSAIAGGAHGSRKVWLTFPKDIIDRPLIWEIGRKFEIVTNIRQASVSKEIGLVGLELSGEDSEIEKAVKFLTDNGVSVEPVELNVVE